MKWSWEKPQPETGDCFGIGGIEVVAHVSHASWLLRSPPSSPQASTALKQWFSEWVYPSSINRNAHSQAHLRPTESETLGVGPSVCPLSSLCWSCRGLTLENHCTWSVLGDDFSLPVPSQHQPLFTLCVIQVFMDTHFSCQLAFKFKLQ